MVLETLQNAAFTRLEIVCVEVKNTGVSKSAKYSVATINTSTTKTCRRIEMAAAKVVPVFVSLEAGSRLPQEARDKDLFYVRPLEKALPGDDTPTTGKAHSAEEAMCKCWRGWTQDKRDPVQQQCRNTRKAYIQERTGHRSLDALRTYERSNDQQQKEVVSSILVCPTRDQAALPSMHANKLWRVDENCRNLARSGLTAKLPTQYWFTVDSLIETKNIENTRT